MNDPLPPIVKMGADDDESWNYSYQQVTQPRIVSYN